MSNINIPTDLLSRSYGIDYTIRISPTGELPCNKSYFDKINHISFYKKQLTHQERCQILCDRLNKSIHYAKNINDNMLDDLEVPFDKITYKVTIDKININNLNDYLSSIINHLYLDCKSVNIHLSEVIFSLGEYYYE